MHKRLSWGDLLGTRDPLNGVTIKQINCLDAIVSPPPRSEKKKPAVWASTIFRTVEWGIPAIRLLNRLLAAAPEFHRLRYQRRGDPAHPLEFTVDHKGKGQYLLAGKLGAKTFETPFSIENFPDTRRKLILDQFDPCTLLQVAQVVPGYVRCPTRRLVVSFQQAPKEDKADVILEFAFEHLLLRHPALSTRAIPLPHLSLALRLQTEPKVLSILPGSYVTLGKELQAALVCSVRSSPLISFHLNSDLEAPLQTLLRLLPSEIPVFNGLRIGGHLEHHLELLITGLPEAHPDVSLDVSTRGRGLTLLAAGAQDLRLLASPFLYHPPSDTSADRSILLGPENPEFVPLNEMPEHLLEAVVMAEDASFRAHRGFDLSALAETLSRDLERGRFARGGSTITMQVVKNVFLHRSKTLERKFAEMLLVWLIERLGLIDKDRLLEVYLNLCEWAPGVIGLRPAAAFYFATGATLLTPGEALFLATMIPRPSRYLLAFDEAGRPTPSQRERMADLERKLLTRGWEPDPTRLDIVIDGPAARRSLPEDEHRLSEASVDLTESEELEPGIPDEEETELESSSDEGALHP